MTRNDRSPGPPAAAPAPGPIREVTRLALPAALGLLSYALMHTVDCALLGRYRTIDQAGAGLTFLLVWTLMCPVLGTMTGLATFGAQYMGAGRWRRAGRHLRSCLLAGTLASVPYLALAFAAPGLVRLLGTDPAVAEAGGHYLRIRLLAAPFMAIAMGTSSFFRGTGDAVTPLKVSLLANLVNLGLDYLLIFGKLGCPELGVSGAALASTAAQAFEAVCFLYLMFSDGRLRRDFGVGLGGRIHWREVRRLIRVGGPIGLYWLADAGAWAAFMALLGRFKDPAVMAANYAAFTLLTLSFLPCVGLLQAAQALVGQYVGARRPAVGRRRGFLCMRLGVAFMTFMGLVIFLFRGSLIGLYNDDPEVVRLGAQVLIYVAIFQPFDAMGMTAIGSLRGAGDTVFAFWAMASLAWLVFLPATYLIAFPLRGGPATAWIAAILYHMLLAAVTTLRLRGRRWESRCV